MRDAARVRCPNSHMLQVPASWTEDGCEPGFHRNACLEAAIAEAPTSQSARAHINKYSRTLSRHMFQCVVALWLSCRPPSLQGSDNFVLCANLDQPAPAAKAAPWKPLWTRACLQQASALMKMASGFYVAL